MKNKKLIIPIVIVAILLFGTIATLAIYFNVTKGENAETIDLSGNNMQVQADSSGNAFIIDLPSDADYDRMMQLLYPNGVIDEQGFDIAGIENIEEARDRFIRDNTKAYYMENGELKEVETTPFKVKMLNPHGEDWVLPFYRARAGEFTTIYPSEWGAFFNCFASNNDAGTYITWSDYGIWQIDPETLETKRITSDTYDGKTIDEIREDSIKIEFSWVSDVALSLDGKNVVYLSKKDCPKELGKRSIWMINLETGKESRLSDSWKWGYMVGFLSDDCLIMQEEIGASIININTGKIIPIPFPEEFPVDEIKNDGGYSGISIKDIKNEVIVYRFSINGSALSTMYVSNINAETGELVKIMEVKDVVYPPSFSPSGNIIGVLEQRGEYTNSLDLLLIDITTGEQKWLKETIGKETEIKGGIQGFKWANDDNTLIIDISDNSSGVSVKETKMIILKD